jgi:hypothetical protein
MNGIFNMCKQLENYNVNILNASLEQCYALRKQIEKFKENNYPSVKLKEFVDELYNINNSFIKIFYNLNSNKINSSEIYFFNQIFSYFMNQVVGKALFADTHQHPLEIMIPVKELIQKLNDDVDFITVPEWNINYAIGDIWSDLYKYINMLKQRDINMDIDIQDKKIVQLIFPLLHKNNILLGGILGHEFGHYLDIHYTNSKMTQEILLICKNHPNINDLAQYLDYNFALSLNPLAISEITNLMVTNSILESWIQEVVADVIGIILYGISSHFSCEKVFMFSRVFEKNKLVDGFSISHPRCSMRSKVRIATLEHLNYENILEEELVNIIKEYDKSWENSCVQDYQEVYSNELNIYGSPTNVKINLNNKSCKLIEEIILDNIQKIIDIIEKNIPSEIKYNFSNIRDVAMPLAKKISNLIPPNELLKRPVDSISIMNSGWIAYYLYKNEIKSFLQEYNPEEQDLKAMEMINNLMSKALMSSHIHRRWNSCS